MVDDFGGGAEWLNVARTEPDRTMTGQPASKKASISERLERIQFDAATNHPESIPLQFNKSSR
jgi:hypothetical protein